LRNCLAIRYAVEGDLRFISHHDSLRLFERAMARAKVPVRYSQGFNPQPRFRIALPRPVGVASLDELLVVEVVSEEAPEDVLNRLRREMPPGIVLIAAESLEAGDHRQPCEVWYSLEIEHSIEGVVAQRAVDFLSQDSVMVDRVTPKSKAGKAINIRQYISTIEVTPQRVAWSQTVTQEGSARPSEVLEALGLPSCDHLHRLCRQKTLYQP
jgi:radical SAM-linked protein